MTVVLLLAGALLVLLAFCDAIITTLAAGNGGGPLTQRLGRGTWLLLRRVSRGEQPGLLPYAGTIVLMVTVLTWVVLLWAGWVLVFSATEDAVLESATRTPADLAGRAYYAGFVIFTLGVGDVVAGSGAWRMVTALASFLGLFLVTLSITYLVSVVSAAVQRRSLARAVSLSGRSGVDLVLLHWDGDQVGGSLPSLLQSLESQGLQVTQQHLAYPVLHHFFSAEEDSDAPRAMAVLDDALVLLDAGLAPHVRPSTAVRTRLRGLLDHYAETVGGRGTGHSELPPLPPLGPLRDAGVPVVDEEEYVQGAESHRARRQELSRLVQLNGRDWPTSA